MEEVTAEEIVLELRQVRGGNSRAALDYVEGFVRGDYVAFCEDEDGLQAPRLVREDAVLFPQWGPPRYFRETDCLAAGVVAQIGGRRWRVRFTPRYEEDGERGPDGGALTFTPADGEEEMPFTPLRDQLDKEGLESGGPPDWYGVQLFGQPRFMQAEAFPASDGRAVPLLFIFNDAWGDAGNWNVFCAFEGGLPVEAYYEASCN